MEDSPPGIQRDQEGGQVGGQASGQQGGQADVHPVADFESETVIIRGDDGFSYPSSEEFDSQYTDRISSLKIG